MENNNIENEIRIIEEKIEELVSLKREKEIENSKQCKRKWIFLKKGNNLEKEILEIEENIKKLQFEIISLKSKDPKFIADLRSNLNLSRLKSQGS